MNAAARKLILDMLTAEFTAADADGFEDATAVYGDDIETSCDLIEEHNCVEPGGHLFLAKCGNVRCIHCGRKG